MAVSEDNSALAPTLLVGLGGVGSRVVDRLYGMLGEGGRRRVSIHSVDTDVNDLSKLNYLTHRHVTQISERQSVGNYVASLQRSGMQTSVEQWLPENVPSHQRMTDGAGQTRAVARLAYHATLRRQDGFRELKDQLNDLFAIDGSGQISTIRVVIVSTLAGGTGAGTFLQTALYVRELISAARPGTSPWFRGAFILPSVAERFNSKPHEKERMSANGYACLKELHAMLLSDDPAGRTKRLNIQLEYMPDQAMDAEGRVNLTVPSSMPIYEFCFVSGAANTAGEHLPSWAHYENQVVRNLYMQMFSPTAESNLSQEDNQVTSAIGEERVARFCSAGTATLEYPYHALVRCLAHRWSRTFFNEEWLALDEAWREQHRQWVDAGQRGSKPERGRVYIQQLRHEAGQRAAKLFFADMWRSLFELDDLSRPKCDKVSRFLDAVDHRVSQVVKGWDSIQSESQRFNLPADLADQSNDRIEALVAAGETALERMEGAINLAVPGEIEYPLLNDVIHEGGRRPQGQPDYSLVAWFLERPEPLHPLAVRAFLYQLLETLDTRLRRDDRYRQKDSESVVEDSTAQGRGLVDDVERLRRTIELYSGSYDLPDTEEREDARRRLFLAKQQSSLARLLRGDRVKEFAEEYRSKAEGQHKSLLRYAEQRARLTVYEQLHECVSLMARRWERCFDTLRDRLPTLHQQEEHFFGEHEKVGDSTQDFVLASRHSKEKLWQELVFDGVSMESTGLRNAVLQEYAKASEVYRERGSDAYTDAGEMHTANEGTADELIETVTQWCRQNLQRSGKLDMNVIQALRKEASVSGLDEVRHVSEKVQRLDNLSKPWVAHAPSKEPGRYRLWGMHPEVREELGSQEFDRLSGQGDVGVNDGFSRYTLHRYQSLYGLRAEDLLEFTAGGAGSPAGPGYERYHRYIRNVDGPNAPRITPHLDKRWHLPAYMPDFNSSRQAQDQRQLRQAFIFGLLYGCFVIVNDRGDQVWQFNGGGAVTELVRERDRPVKGQLHRLYEALQSNPTYVDQVINYSNYRKRMDIEHYSKIWDTAFYKFNKSVDAWNQKNIIDVILSMRRSASAQGYDDEIVHLTAQALEVLGDFFCEFYRVSPVENMPSDAAGYLRKLVDSLYEESDEYKSFSEDERIRTQVDHVRKSFVQRIGVQAAG